MSIVRWAPFSAFTSVERQMKSVLDQFAGRGWLEGFDWKPDTDVYREGDVLVVRAELAGIDPDDITVDVEGSVLHLSGEKKIEHKVDEGDRFVHECRFGSFRRDVMLPEGIEAETIDAAFENGVLVIRIPIPADAEDPGIVPIEVKQRDPLPA